MAASVRWWLVFLALNSVVTIPAIHAGPVSINSAVPPFGRNIRPIACVSKSGDQGVCMFAMDCTRINGKHLGTCIDRFYFGSCCGDGRQDNPEDHHGTTPVNGNDIHHLPVGTSSSQKPSGTSSPAATTQDPLSTITTGTSIGTTTLFHTESTEHPSNVLSQLPPSQTGAPVTTTTSTTTTTGVTDLPSTTTQETTTPTSSTSSTSLMTEVTTSPITEAAAAGTSSTETAQEPTQPSTTTTTTTTSTPSSSSTDAPSSTTTTSTTTVGPTVKLTEAPPAESTEPPATEEPVTAPPPNESEWNTEVPTTSLPDSVDSTESLETESPSEVSEPSSTTTSTTTTTAEPSTSTTTASTTAAPPSSPSTTEEPITTPTPSSTTQSPSTESSSTSAAPSSTVKVDVEVSTELPAAGTSTTTATLSSTVGGVVESNQTETTATTGSLLSVTSTVSPWDNETSTTVDGATVQFQDYKEVCGRPKYHYPTARIVGGSTTQYGQWPWQVSLRQWRTATFLHKCGAALLNENWAITAAHCVDNVQPDDLLLRMGEYDLATDEEEYPYVERKVQIVASHPQFDSRTFEYDLALLRFYDPVRFQPNIVPICLPDVEPEVDFVGRTAYVTGWGRLYEDGPLPSKMQQVDVPIINNTECENMYRRAGYVEHIPNIFICAGYSDGKRDSCEGDSGGPLVIQVDNVWRLAGVISWGIGCAEANQPGVYTRITEFREWIDKIIVF